MKKAVVFALMVCALTMTGCQKKEAPVATLGSPSPTILEETILHEDILYEEVLYEEVLHEDILCETWDNSPNITTWD